MWLHVPETFCRSAPASTGLDSALNWQFRLAAKSVMLKGKRTAQKSLYAGCKRASWMNALFGRMCGPSKASRGVALWIQSLRESPAKATASPENATSKTTRETSGPTRGESYAKWEPTSYFWKMSQACLFQNESGDSQRLSHGYSESWPKTGSMRNGCLYRRPPLELRTSGSGFSCWPTANAHDGRRPGHDDDSTQGMNLKREAENWPTPGAAVSNEGETPETWQARADKIKEQGINGNGAGMPLAIAAQLWQSPGNMGGGSVSRGGERIGEPLLAGQAEQASQWMTPEALNTEGYQIVDGKKIPRLGAQASAQAWTTPQAHDTHKRSKGQTSGTLDNGAGNACLATDAELWMMPRASMAENGNDSGSAKRELQGPNPGLKTQSETWATPSATSDANGCSSMEKTTQRHQRCGPGHVPKILREQAELSPTGPQAQPTSPPGSESLPSDPTSRRRRLNPKFVCWLMGLPENWVDVEARIEPISFDAWVTLSSALVRQWLSAFYGND